MVTFAPLMMVATFGSWLIRKIDPNESVTPGPGGTAGKTNVRLWTGLPSESCADFEGNAPSVAVYDEEGHLLGKVKGSGKENGVWTLHPGELHDYSLSVENESIARPTYIQIDACEFNTSFLSYTYVWTYVHSGQRRALHYRDRSHVL